MNFSRSALFHIKTRVFLKYFVCACGCQISTQFDNFNFLEQICPEKVFPIKNKKSEYHRWILHIWISLDTKFQIKQTISSFWTRFVQKGYFWSKTRRNEHHQWILHIRIRVGTKFQPKLTILIFLAQICPKTVFPVVNRKSEHQHWICVLELI